MTVPATARRAGPSNGSGLAATLYPFTFKVFAKEDLLVVLTDALGNETVGVLDSDYLVTLNVDQDATPGGSVQYATGGVAAALASNRTITITGGGLEFDQPADLPTGGNFSAVVVENALDNLEMQIQLLRDQSQRSLTLALSADTDVSTVLPPPQAHTSLGWNDDENALINIDLNELVNSVVYGTSVVDLRSGNGSQTLFALTSSPGALTNMDVSVGGVDQRAGIDYTWPGGAAILFAIAPPIGTDNIQVKYQQALPQGATTLDSIANVIASDITLNVPASYATIQAAMAYLSDQLIATGVTVTIKVADGTLALSSGINLNHPQGAQIQLIGNQVNAANCVLQVTGQPSFDAISVTEGHCFGLIDGFRIRSTVKADSVHNYTGILAYRNATIICGPKLEVDNFYYGIAARDGSFVSCDGAVVTNSGDVGIWSFCGSTVIAHGASSTGAIDAPNSLGFGFQAEYGSTLVATAASASGCLRAGFAALSNSTCRLFNCISNGNTGSGFLSLAGGQIEAFGASGATNTRYAYEITEYGNIIGVADGGGNALGVTNNFPYFNQVAGQAQVTSATGDARYDAAGSNIFFNTSGGLQHTIRNAAAVTTQTFTQGGNAGTSNQPTYGVDGAAANISVRYQSKGTGSIFLNTGAGNQVEVIDTGGTAVNKLQLAGSPTTFAVNIRARGTDANVGMGFDTKGAGAFTFTSNSFASTEFQINPSGGTSYLAVSSSLSDQPSITSNGAAANVHMRVNVKGDASHLFHSGGGRQMEIRAVTTPTSYALIQGGNAGTADQPGFGVDGAAANISMRVNVKGTGSHFFNSGGGTQFEVQNTAGAVNRLAATGSAAGLGQLSAVGTSADIDIFLATKGAGVVRFGTYTATGDVACNGYILIRDFGGTLRKLMTTA